ncbi:MAG TPA: c-type cytochrome [Sphingomicrobium sp.]|jgi:mono/diheme cytochrome c family protein|nr:c-type cytochrome [Sphingomicrobium sp.]
MSAAWPRSFTGRTILVIAALILLLVLISAGTWLWFSANEPKFSDPPPGLLSILTEPIPEGPNADLIRRGRYLTIAGDCASCHTRRGGRPFEGGLGLQTPFGIIYSANLTSDRDNGIGAWTPEQFFNALHNGAAPGNKRLYPALPYPHFTIVSRADTDAILAYLKTVPPVHYAQPGNRLPFPVDIRASLIAWNALNFSPHAFQGNSAMSAQWNRGAYLVEGLEHCGACHTPKNVLGAELNNQAYRGAAIENWVAPDLTGNPRTGLGRWSSNDIVQYLQTGRNAHANASGLMGEVVAYSTSLLSDSDLLAIAAYLKSLPASPTLSSGAPDAAAMRAGSAIFFDACTACHLAGGKGQPGMFPPLQGSNVAQQDDPTGVIHLILAGTRTAPTRSRPGFQSMPSFAWKLSDQEVADVATYIRNSWGNRAPPVDARRVAKLRSKLKLTQPLASDQR